MNVPNLVEWGSKGGIEPLADRLTLVVVRVGRVGPVKHGSVTDNHVVQKNVAQELWLRQLDRQKMTKASIWEFIVKSLTTIIMLPMSWKEVTNFISTSSAV
jgi:hypothetical protein